MKSIEKAFIMLLILGMYAMPIAMAEGNNTTTNTTTATVTQTSVPAQTTTAIVTQTTVAEVKEKKFRVGPTVRIRPLNDQIKKDQDGMVELYMDNPSLNDITLTVDARISVPSGIHVYGQGFGEAAAAGMVYGKFEIPPGSARTINIVIKAEKTGDFNAQFSGMYWPGDNKDAYQPISLTHPFRVLEASKNPNEASVGTTGEGKEAKKESPGMTAGVAIVAIAILAYALRRN